MSGPATALPEGMRWQRVCDSGALAEGGDGMRFEIDAAGGKRQAFVVRYDRQPRAYLNRCAHVPVELDWQSGKFFDSSGLYLICATHGALYEPTGGRCVGGPCSGRPLVRLPAEEADGAVWVAVNQGVR